MVIYAVKDNIMSFTTDISLSKKALMETFNDEDIVIYKHDMKDDEVVPLDSEYWIPEEGKVYRDGFFFKVGERIIPEDEYDGDDEDCTYGLIYDKYMDGIIVDYGFEEV